MTPQVEAAWIAGASGLLGVLIGVTGTVIVGVAGFRNTRAATDKAVLAAHSERAWDRKADAYQDALAASLWRNHRRMYLTTADLTEEQYAEAANAVFLMQTEQTGGRCKAGSAPSAPRRSSRPTTSRYSPPSSPTGAIRNGEMPGATSTTPAATAGRPRKVSLI